MHVRNEIIANVFSIRGESQFLGTVAGTIDIDAQANKEVIFKANTVLGYGQRIPH